MITNNIIKLTLTQSSILNLGLPKLVHSTGSLRATAIAYNFYLSISFRLVSPFATIKKPQTAPPQIAQPPPSLFKQVGSLTAQDLTEDKLASLQQ